MLLPLRPAPEVHGKRKNKVVEKSLPESSDEGKCYSNLLDHLLIPEDFFLEIDPFTLASSLSSSVDSSSSYNMSSVDSSDTGRVPYLAKFHTVCLRLCNAPNFDFRLCAAYCMFFLKNCLLII